MNFHSAAWLLALAAVIGCDDDPAATADGRTTTDGATDRGTTDTGTDAAADMGPPGLASPEALADAIDLTAFAADLEFIARPRAPGTPHWQAVQDRCAEVFTEAGFTVERHDYGTGVNVIGVRPGTTTPRELVVVSGHYDHISECSGADDNASGTAGVLAIARALADTHFERTLVLACWDEEELGLVGARHWVARTKRQAFEVKASYVLESMGYFTDEPQTQSFPPGFEFLFPEAGAFVADRQNRGDFIAAVSDDIDASTLDDFAAGGERVGLPVARIVLNAGFRTDPSLGDLRRSDHAEFWAADWPGMMVTCSANFRNPNYHCARGDDDLPDLDLERALKVVQATAFAAARQARPAQGMGQPLDTTTDPMPPPAPVCDLVAQDCPDGQKCAFVDATATFRCQPDGNVPEGDAICTRGTDGPGDDDCVRGTYCAFFGQPLMDPQTRTCHPLCHRNSDCQNGEICVEILPSVHAGVCFPPCDPLDPSACGEGQVCWRRPAAAPADGRVTTCQPGTPGMTQRGEACGGAVTCAPGLFCLSAIAGLPAQCQPWCANDADCGEGFGCLPSGVPDRGICVPN